MSEKENYYTLEYGNSDGCIRFGSIESSSGSVRGEVVSDVKLQASYEGHYITLDKDGQREGWTVSRCPGTYSVTCGEFYEGPGKENAFIVIAKQGDIVLKAENGDIRMIARNIEVLADGPDNDRGVIKMKANESITLNSKNVFIDSEVSMKFVSSGLGEIACRTSMQLYAGFIKSVTGASAINPSKYGGKDTKKVVEEYFPPG